VAVGTDHVTLLNLFQQPRVCATLGDKVGDRGFFYGAVAVVKLHDPRVESASAILTGSLFDPQQNVAQTPPLSVLISTILSDVARFVSLIVKTMVGTLARLTFALESVALAAELISEFLN
jgi:hypothetical protein